MSSTSSLIHCIDHIMIRVDDAVYEQVFALFADTFELPISWAVQNYYPPFKAGGIVAGNISMEIFRSGEQPLYPSQAQIYGIALEATPLPECLPELTRRGIPHLPPYAIPEGYLSNRGEHYTLIYVGELLGGDLTRFFFEEQIGLGAIDSLIFDQIFPNGTVFLCEYNPSFWSIPQKRAEKRAQLQEKHGGSLGLEEVRELIVGVTDLEKSQGQWQRLFAPLVPVSENEWGFKEGPMLRLVPHERDEVVAMTWKVGSLERARAFLQAKDMLGETTTKQVIIKSESAFGLEIRLIE